MLKRLDCLHCFIFASGVKSHCRVPFVFFEELRHGLQNGSLVHEVAWGLSKAFDSLLDEILRNVKSLKFSHLVAEFIGSFLTKSLLQATKLNRIVSEWPEKN